MAMNSLFVGFPRLFWMVYPKNRRSEILIALDEGGAADPVEDAGHLNFNVVGLRIWEVPETNLGFLPKKTLAKLCKLSV